MSCVCNDSASASAASLLARPVSQALFAAAPMHLLRMLLWSSNRESCNTRLVRWGRPKLHSQVLTSYTWLPLHNTISKLGNTYYTYEILARLRLLYFNLCFTYRPVKHAFTKVTYYLLIIHLFYL